MQAERRSQTNPLHTTPSPTAAAPPSPKVCPIESEPHVFCPTCIHSSVWFPGFIARREVCNVLQTSLPELRIQLDGRDNSVAADEAFEQ